MKRTKIYSLTFIGLCFLIFFINKFSGEYVSSPFNGKRFKLTKENNACSFIVAGHIYGAPGESLFPSANLITAIGKINDSKTSFFISLGDNFRKTNSKHIKEFLNKFAKKIKIPIFNAVGNHDVTDRSFYEKKFGKTYFDFLYGKSLFIFLDTEINTGQIKGKQLNYFQNLIDRTCDNGSIDSIFIFSHKLIWVYDSMNFKILYEHINSRYGYAENGVNFKEDIKPYLVKASLSGKSIYWFSGDIGVSWSNSLFYDKDKENNITYIATGLGDTPRDLIIKVDIDGESRVKFLPISLTKKKVGKIDEYGVGYWEEYFKNK